MLCTLRCSFVSLFAASNARPPLTPSPTTPSRFRWLQVREREREETPNEREVACLSLPFFWAACPLLFSASSIFLLFFQCFSSLLFFGFCSSELRCFCRCCAMLLLFVCLLFGLVACVCFAFSPCHLTHLLTHTDTSTYTRRLLYVKLTSSLLTLLSFFCLFFFLHILPVLSSRLHFVYLISCTLSLPFQSLRHRGNNNEKLASPSPSSFSLFSSIAVPFHFQFAYFCKLYFQLFADN